MGNSCKQEAAKPPEVEIIRQKSRTTHGADIEQNLQRDVDRAAAKYNANQNHRSKRATGKSKVQSDQNPRLDENSDQIAKNAPIHSDSDDSDEIVRGGNVLCVEVASNSAPVLSTRSRGTAPRFLSRGDMPSLRGSVGLCRAPSFLVMDDATEEMPAAKTTHLPEVFKQWAMYRMGRHAGDRRRMPASLRKGDTPVGDLQQEISPNCNRNQHLPRPCSQN